jgi:hypothetical protein
LLLTDRISEPQKRVVNDKQAEAFTGQILVKIRFSRTWLTYDQRVTFDRFQPGNVGVARNQYVGVPKTAATWQC